MCFKFLCLEFVDFALNPLVLYTLKLMTFYKLLIIR